MAESVIYSVNSNNTVYVDATPVTLSLNINCISASATHTLTIKNGNTTLVTKSLGSFPAGSSTQSVSLTSPQRTAILNSIPNVASFTATYVLSTTLNNVSQGTSSCTGKIAVDPNVSSPDIDAFTYADTNPKTVAFTGDDQCVVPGYSNIVLYSVSATAHNGASIVEYQVTSDIVTDWRRYSQGGTINYGTIPTPTTLNDPTEYSIFVMPIDSRNFATQGYKAIPHVYLYNAPTVIATSLKRNSADPSQIDISFSGTYSNMAQNAVTASYKFKETSASTYGADNAIAVTTSGSNFSCSLTGVGSFAETTAYDVVLTIADKITTRTYNFVLAQENPLIAFRDDAVGFGTVPQGTKRVEVASDWSIVNKGKYEAPTNQYYTSGNYAINLNNSDVVGANGIFFADVANSLNEGLLYTRANGNYDVLYALNGDVYVRRDQDIAGTLVAGTRLLTVDDLYYKPGDTYSGTYMVINGLITSASKGLRFGLTVPKMLDNISTVTVTSMTGTLRSVLGYIDSDSSNRDVTSLGTVTTNIRNSNYITIAVDASTAFTNVTNNTPIVFYSNSSFTLTFS